MVRMNANNYTMPFNKGLKVIRYKKYTILRYFNVNTYHAVLFKGKTVGVFEKLCETKEFIDKKEIGSKNQ